jgi:hypothetical protein
MKKIFQQSSMSVHRLLQQSHYLDYLSKRVLTYLPDEFIDKLSILSFRKKKNQHCLTIATISAAWASKLRFYTPILKRSLKTEPKFDQLEKIIIKVLPNKFNLTTQQNKGDNPVYSDQSALLIEQSANHIDNDALKATMMRLALHVKK